MRGLRSFTAVLIGACTVLAVASPAGAGGPTPVSIPYTCDAGDDLGLLSAPIEVVPTATPNPADIFQKVTYTADFTLPDLTPQAFAVNFNFFRVTLDVPPGLRAVSVSVQDPAPLVANPAVSEISAVISGNQLVVSLPVTPSTTKRFHFGTNGVFSYPFNVGTQSGGTPVVLPRIKVTAMPIFASAGSSIDWTAPDVDTETNFGLGGGPIGAIPCTPDNQSATVFSNDVTETVRIPANGYVDVPAALDPAVDWAKYLKVIKTTFSGNRYLPTDAVTRSQAVVALWNMVDRPVGASQHPFTDVPVGAAYDTALDWAFSEGVVPSPGNHKFKPNDPVLRGPLAAMAFQMVEADEASPWPAFHYTDVPVGAPYAEALRWADDAGVVNEFSAGTKVKPTLAATRGDLARLLFKVAQDPEWFRPLPTTVLVDPA